MLRIGGRIRSSTVCRSQTSEKGPVGSFKQHSYFLGMALGILGLFGDLK